MQRPLAFVSITLSLYLAMMVISTVAYSRAADRRKGRTMDATKAPLKLFETAANTREALPTRLGALDKLAAMHDKEFVVELKKLLGRPRPENRRGEGSGRG